MAKLTVYFLLLLVVIGVFSPIIANDDPIWCSVEGNSYFPAWSEWAGSARPASLRKIDWSTSPVSDRVMPPIPFSGTQHSQDRALPPFSKTEHGWHWLGTDKEGKDVLAGLVEGTTGALKVGALAVIVAFILGGILGGCAGYFGDERLRLPYLLLPLVVVIVFYWYFLLFASNIGSHFSNIQKAALTLAVLLALGMLVRLFRLGPTFGFPLDLVIMRLAEVFDTVPKLVLLLAFCQVMERPTQTTIAIMIGFLSWPGTARLLRGELLKLRNAPFIEAVRQLGLPRMVIFWRHALPSAIRPIALVVALGAGQAVLLDASLTFLNLGGSTMGRANWGDQLQSARYSIGLVWVWMSPSILLVLLSGSLYYWSNRLTLNK